MGNFPKDFEWGAATASYQVEGAAYEDGRGESIWDTFSRVPGKVYAGENGNVAVDQYHRYPEDIALMKDLGIHSYRFSIAWPRIIPEGRGAVNPKGVAYYKGLMEALLEAGIEPVPTLYHWDLPQPLQEQGGWTNRATSEAFETYAEVCFKEFSPYVKKWITLNEPFCSAYLGYLWGIHAPGIEDKQQACEAVHFLNLAHGLAVKKFRSLALEGSIGITWNLMTPEAASDSKQDRAAQAQSTAIFSEVFTDPVLGLGYPENALEQAGVSLPEGYTEDLKTISLPIDFIGMNYYTETIVGEESDELPKWEPVTDMGWPIVPDGLLRQFRWIHKKTEGKIPLYITENGMANRDALDPRDKRVHDPERIDYLKQHFEVCSQAIEEGIQLKGYFLWSLLDNFEWAYGYTKRFGIIFCDYATMERTPKDSFYYYRDVIRRNSV